MIAVNDFLTVGEKYLNFTIAKIEYNLKKFYLKNYHYQQIVKINVDIELNDFILAKIKDHFKDSGFKEIRAVQEVKQDYYSSPARTLYYLYFTIY